jgi:hypothetical protein
MGFAGVAVHPTVIHASQIASIVDVPGMKPYLFLVVFVNATLRNRYSLTLFHSFIVCITGLMWAGWRAWRCAHLVQPGVQIHRHRVHGEDWH